MRKAGILILILGYLGRGFGAPAETSGGFAGSAGAGAPMVQVAPAMAERPMIAMAPVPMPPPPVMIGGGPCIEEGATGFVNETCQTSSDCYDSSSMICSNKKCRCATNYVEDSANTGSKKICASVPSLLSPCSTTCQAPFECKLPTSTDVIPGFPMAPGKICLCPGKSRYVNGYCDAGCKPEQRIGAGGECVARCTKDQVLIDGQCKKMANVGETCTDDAQCVTAFTTCQSGKCSCANGFGAQGAKCVPKIYTCPYGDALKKGDSVVLCESASNGFPVCFGGMCPMMSARAQGGGPPPPAPPPTAAMAVSGSSGGATTSVAFGKPYKTDSCPSSHYCINYDYSGQGARGHCCPKPALKCPVGEAHPTAQCNGAGGQYCPYQTHTCLNVGSPGDYGSQLCCPKPCQGYDKVLVKDQCMPTGQYGDGCQYNEQCQQINGVCSGGKCTCGPKSTPIDNGMAYKYCQINCDSDEIAVGGQCQPRLKLGDKCSPDQPYCPSGAYCNRKGVCACLCEYKKINEKFCAPPPYCPTNPFKSQSANVSKDITKYTLCKLDGVSGKPAMPVSDTCPGKTFCSYYSDNMGVCCPEPEPWCPDGSKPASTVSCHNGEKTCGPSEMCNVYFVAATTKATGVPRQGSACCPMMQPMPMPVPMDMAKPVASPVQAAVAASPPAGGSQSASRKTIH